MNPTNQETMKGAVVVPYIRGISGTKSEYVQPLAEFEVLTAVSTKMAVFWVVAPTRLHGATTQKTAIFVQSLDHELRYGAYSRRLNPKMKSRKQETAYTASHTNAGRNTYERQEDHLTAESPNINATKRCKKYRSPKQRNTRGMRTIEYNGKRQKS
jgi:hypothetical protein